MPCANQQKYNIEVKIHIQTLQWTLLIVQINSQWMGREQKIPQFGGIPLWVGQYKTEREQFRVAGVTLSATGGLACLLYEGIKRHA